MTIRVIAWPPVGVTGTEWTEEAPVERSRSLITGADYVSTRGRIRRLAALDVSALARGRSGAGYMEMLKRHLAGGVHAVRLNSYPVNWHFDALDDSWRQSDAITWDGLSWTSGGSDLSWYSGTVLTGTTGTDSNGWQIVTVAGLPANKLVARPGEFVTLFDDGTERRAQVTAEARSDSAGQAVVRTFETLPALTDARVNLGTSDTGVFRAVELPRAKQPLGANWTYSWQFREVFADEVGGFTEVDPWR